MSENLAPCKGKGIMVVGFLMVNVAGGLLMESEFKVLALLAFLFGFLMFIFGNIQNYIIVAKWKKTLNNKNCESSKEAGRQICDLGHAS